MFVTVVVYFVAVSVVNVVACMCAGKVASIAVSCHGCDADNNFIVAVVGGCAVGVMLLVCG